MDPIVKLYQRAYNHEATRQKLNKPVRSHEPSKIRSNLLCYHPT
jgi:hypothetical protein